MKTSCQTHREDILTIEPGDAASASLQAHLDDCAECRECWSAHQGAQQLGTLLQQRQAPRSAAWALQRLEARRDARPAAQTPGPIGVFWWIAAPVATALVAVLFFGPPSTERGVTAPPQLARTSPHHRDRTPPRAPMSPRDAKALQRLMAQAFDVMDSATSVSKPWVPEERIAKELGRALEDDASQAFQQLRRLALGRVFVTQRLDDDVKDTIAALGVREVDPSPISQRLPAPLSSLSALLGGSDTREL